jgi:hypothetical protein
MASVSEFSENTIKDNVSNEETPYTLGGIASLYNNSYYEVSKFQFLKYTDNGIGVTGGFYKHNPDKTGIVPATSASEARFFAVCTPQKLEKKRVKNYNALVGFAENGDAIACIDLEMSGYQATFFTLTKEEVKKDDFITFNDEYGVRKAVDGDTKLAKVVRGGYAGSVIEVDFNVK